MDGTSASLLFRLRQPTDSLAWEHFVLIYSPIIYGWGCKAGLQSEDAADLTQDVLVALVQKLREFHYDPQKRFRCWLRTVVMNQLRDRVQRKATRALPGVGERLDQVAGENGVEQLIDQEYRQAVITRALELLQKEFEPRTWKAFWERTVHGRAAMDVAAELSMTPGAVYTATSRVLARLRIELQGLLD